MCIGGEEDERLKTTLETVRRKFKDIYIILYQTNNNYGHKDIDFVEVNLTVKEEEEDNMIDILKAIGNHNKALKK